MIRRRHRQGIFSSTETGVCPNSSRNFFDGFFLRLRTSPRSITTSCSYLTPSIRIVPKENFWKRILDFHLTDQLFATRCRLHLQRLCQQEKRARSLRRTAGTISWRKREPEKRQCVGPIQNQLSLAVMLSFRRYPHTASAQ